MNWLPFFIAVCALGLWVCSCVFFLDTESYRNWVKRQHQNPILIGTLLVLGLSVPLVAIILQNT